MLFPQINNEIVTPTFLYQYLIMIHTLCCVFLILQYIFLGIKPSKETHCKIKMAILFFWIVPAIQIPISLSRIIFSLSPEFNLSKPVDAYLNFFWSPMCSSLFIWAGQIYVALNCKCQHVNLRNKKINYTLVWYLAGISLLLGYTISHGLYSYSISFGLWNNYKYLLFITSITLIGTFLEMVIPILYYQIVNLVSYSLLFCIGTWLYFLNIIKW